MQNAIVTLSGKEPRTTSLLIAEGCDIDHASVIKLVRNYTSDLSEFGHMDFKSEVVERPQGGGSMREYALLNEQQSTLILAYMRNTPVVREFKKNLVREFYRMKQALLNQQNLSWQQQRLNGKVARRVETDVIARFVEYATSQGSGSAKMYFMQITKMTHRALSLVRQSGPSSFRDMLDSMQLSFLTTAEYLVQQALVDGMDSGLHYKDVYQLARDRVSHYAVQLPQMRIIAAA